MTSISLVITEIQVKTVLFNKQQSISSWAFIIHILNVQFDYAINTLVCSFHL